MACAPMPGEGLVLEPLVQDLPETVAKCKGNSGFPMCVSDSKILTNSIQLKNRTWLMLLRNSSSFSIAL